MDLLRGKKLGLFETDFFDFTVFNLDDALLKASLFFVRFHSFFAAFRFARSLQSPAGIKLPIDLARTTQSSLLLLPCFESGTEQSKRVLLLSFPFDRSPHQNRDRTMVTHTSLEALDAARAEVKLAGEGATADQLRNYLRLVRKRYEERDEKSGESRELWSRASPGAQKHDLALSLPENSPPPSKNKNAKTTGPRPPRPRVPRRRPRRLPADPQAPLFPP